jgi:putative transposase
MRLVRQPDPGQARAPQRQEVVQHTLLLRCVSEPQAHYRHLRGPRQGPALPRPAPPRALSDLERAAVLDELHSERFVDASPAATYATLLDEGTYLASQRTMYRILAAATEVRERRDQLRHPAYARPELLATGPRELFSWDITKLRGPAKWTHFHLYVILDVFSRYVPGWMVATAESAVLAERLIAETVEKEGIVPGQLTIHADRGTSMRSKPVALLLADLGIERTHSRPHVSNDCDPFSESQFRTLKYRPTFPDRFGSLEDARAFCSEFFTWSRSTTTAGSGSSPRPTSMPAGPARSLPPGRSPSTPPMRPIPNASSAGRPHHRWSRPPSGSTRQRRRGCRLSSSHDRVSHGA